MPENRQHPSIKPAPKNARTGPQLLRSLQTGLDRIGQATGIRLLSKASRWLPWAWYAGIRLPTFWLRVRPNFVLIGTSKSGTSSLAAYLSEQPDFYPPLIKEAHYFDDLHRFRFLSYRAFFPTIFRKLWCRVRGRPFVTGEFTPSYYFIPSAPARLADALGTDTKLILMLRDPIERAYSGYRSTVRHGLESRSFEQAIRADIEFGPVEMQKMRDDPDYRSEKVATHGYLTRGHYAQYLKLWSTVFPRENIMVVLFDDFTRDTKAVIAEVCAFIGLDDPGEMDFPIHNPGISLAKDMDAATYINLVSYFEPLNQELSVYLDRALPWPKRRVRADEPLADELAEEHAPQTRRSPANELS